jgi:diguanylate cyclase (GGDEF)-like protein
VANRRCFDQRLAEEWQRHARECKPLALLLVDVDAFKALNDACGHLHGDECLRVLARVCSDVVAEPGDLVARYGGEEFGVLLPRRELSAARRLAERLRREVVALDLTHPASAVAPCITVSVGISAARPTSGRSPDALIGCADAALYLAKARGRNRVVARSLAAPRSVRRA